MADFTTETFADLNNWTEIGPTGRWAATGGQLVVTAGANAQHLGIIYNTPASSIAQYTKVQYVGRSGDGSIYPRFIFRRTGTAGDKFYEVGGEDSSTDNKVRWGYGTDDADLAPAGDIVNTGNFASDLVPGDWIGAEVTLTGNDTVMKVWKWASDPGAYDAGYTNWGAASVTYTTDPGANACDTGLYLGLFCYFATSGATVTFDNWTGGPAAAGGTPAPTRQKFLFINSKLLLPMVFLGALIRNPSVSKREMLDIFRYKGCEK